MRKIVLIWVILLLVTALHAQRDTTFYRHELKVSIGDAAFGNAIWILEYDYNKYNDNANLNFNISISYFYRLAKWFWVGGNFVNYFGGREEYKCKEYNTDGSINNIIIKSKMKYCAAFAPEIRLSYLNKEHISIYSAFSTGICFENGYDSRHYKYPEINSYFQLTLFGISGNFGKKTNIFLGGEIGLGFKGIFIFHGGYRF